MLDSNSDNQPENTEFISLVAGGQGYCIEITLIREIRRWSTVTSLPNSDPSVLGVMNLRGAVIPILNLSARLGFPPTELGPRCVVVVVGMGSRVAGLAVDAVSEIISTPKNAIKPNPNVGSDADSGQITGLFAEGDKMLKILTVESLFDFQPESIT